MNLEPKRARRWSHKFVTLAGASLMLSLYALVGVQSAAAEQIEIIDASGKTRSMANVSAGATATVSVAVEGASGIGVDVALESRGSDAVKDERKTNSKGIARFQGISAGTYVVSIASSSEATLSDVKISQQQTQSSAARSDDKTRKVSRAMYVGGASAVAGVAGVVAAVAGGGSGGGDSSENESLGFVSSDAIASSGEGGSEGSPRSSSAAQVDTAAYGADAPDPGEPSPAPDQIEVNDAPPAPDDYDHQEPETPEIPDVPAPPPDPIYPPSPI